MKRIKVSWEVDWMDPDMTSEYEAQSPLKPADVGSNAEFDVESLLVSSATPDLFLEDLSEVEERRHSGVKWMIGSGVLFAAGLAGWLGYHTFLKSPSDPIAIPTMPVEVGSIELSITESGMVELGGQQTFKAPNDVTVEAVPIQERQRIEAGTVLLALRDRTLQRQLNNQRVENQKAQNILARKREIIQEKQEKLQTAQDRFADSQSLFDRGFISEDEYRQDQQAVDDALSALKDAQVELTNAELDVRNNQLTLQNIRTQLTDNQIISPMDAVVLKIEVKPGDGVSQGGRLLTIGDPSKETVRLQLSTLNAAKVSINMPVRVSMIGPNPQVFKGYVSRVSPQAVSESGDNSVRGGNDRAGKVEAEAILETPSGGALIPGSIVSVEIILEKQQAVVTVPLTAIQNDGSSQFVWLKDQDGKAQKQEVTLGLQNLQTVEITSGLQVGDEIAPALPPGIELTPGTPFADPAENPAGGE